MHKTDYRISFHDCDPAGIIFFANLMKIIHSAYEVFLNDLKLPIDFFNDDNYILPIVHAEADYIKPIRFNMKVSINIEVLLIKEFSFELDYRIIDAEGNKLASAKTVHVSVNKKSFMKTGLPRELIEGLNRHLSLA